MQSGGRHVETMACYDKEVVPQSSSLRVLDSYASPASCVKLVTTGKVPPKF